MIDRLPLALTAPEPLIVPLVKEKGPETLTVPVPPSVPLETVKFVKLAAVLKLPDRR